MWLAITQRLIISFVADIFYFPIWWYTKGTVVFFGFCRNMLLAGNRFLKPGLWLQHIFTPMFGQNDLGGRFVSFIVRLMNVIVRGVVLIMWLVLVSLFLIGWLVAPIVVLVQFLSTVF